MWRAMGCARVSVRPDPKETESSRPDPKETDVPALTDRSDSCDRHECHGRRRPVRTLADESDQACSHCLNARVVSNSKFQDRERRGLDTDAREDRERPETWNTRNEKAEASLV